MTVQSKESPTQKSNVLPNSLKQPVNDNIAALKEVTEAFAAIIGYNISTASMGR